MSQRTPPKTSLPPEAAQHGQAAPPQQGYPVFPTQFAPGASPGYAWPPGVPPGGYSPHPGQQAWGWPQPALFPGVEAQHGSLQYPGHPTQIPPFPNPYQITYPLAPTGAGAAPPQLQPSQTPAQRKDEVMTNVGGGLVRGTVDEGGRQGRGRSVERPMEKPLVYPGHGEVRVAPEDTEEKELLQRLESWSTDDSSSAVSHAADWTAAAGSVMAVTGLSDDVDEDDVADFFENKKRGGFPVERVELDGSSALVHFSDPAAVSSILKKGPFMMKKRKLVVRAHDPTTGESMQMAEETSGELPQNKEYACQLLVRGLSRDVDEEDVADFFEHKRRGGFAVEKVELDQATASAVVHFREEKAVDAVLQLDSLVWRKRELEVVSYALEQKRLEEEALERQRELSRMLLVRGLPRDVDEEDVADFFENKRRGGFAVEKVKLDQAAAKAVVFFQEAKAVETILQMGPLMMHKAKLDVRQYDPSTDTEKGSQGGRRTLLVAGLPAGQDRAGLQEYLESGRRGGFTVDRVELRPGGRTALVHFQEPEAVDAILKLTPLVWKKTTLNICACTPEMEEEFRAQSQDDDDKAVSGKGASLILQVTGLPSPVEEEFLTNFFESRRVSGGYGVERVELQQETHSALIYFEDPEAVKTVLQKAPHLMKKKQISVNAYTEPPKNRGQRKKEKAKTEEEGKEQEEEEGEDSCTVAVRGYGDTSVETLEMYFENTRKSGGEDVQSCFEDEKEKVIYVTFQSPQVAKRVNERSGHTVGRRKLTVSLHRARPCCPDRVFLTGVPASVSKESLINFLEARTKHSVRDVLYGEEEGTALVTLGEKYDLGALEKALKQRGLEGSEVKARPVAVSDAVLVRGVSPSVSRDTLELYFDNTRKSGGQDVQEVEELGEGTWLVTFADYQVASRVCERSHHLSNAKLQVSLYVECLGPEGGDPDPWSFPLPPPLSVPVPHPLLLRFLRESPSQGHALQDRLAQRHAQVRLDDVTALVVTCTLTRETPQGKRLARTWTEDVQTAVRDFLRRFQVEEVRMSPTICAEMAKDANRFQPMGDGAVVHIESKTSTIVVVGIPSATSPIIQTIKAAKEQHEAELEKRRQTVEETITNLRPHQLQFLSAIAFPQKAMQNTQDLEVAIDISKGEVKFKGLFNLVKPIQIKMFETAQNLRSHRLRLSPSQGSILNVGKVQEILRKQLQKEGLVAVWELADGELTLWAATDQDVVQAAHVIKAAVQERTLNLDPESAALLTSKEWERMKKAQEGREGLMIITVDPTRREIIVTSVEELLAPALEEIRNFLKENTLYKAKLRFPPGRQRFLTEHLSSKIHDLQNNNRTYHVKISTGKEFVLEGTMEGLRRAEEGLRALAASIKSRPHREDDSTMVTFLKSPRGKEVIVLTQRDARCVILDQDDKTDQPTVEGALAKLHTASPEGGYHVTPGVTLFVTKGDITAMKVDAIVNAANEKLQHYGGLAHAINQKAGPGFQEECTAYWRQHGALREGEVMVSGPGNLPCQKVIHAVGPRYHGGQSGEEARLKEAVQGSLGAAHSLRLGSIAMPALSSGIFGYPVREATQVIVESIKEYFESNPSSSLREVHLVNGSPDIVQHFHRAAAKRLNSTQPREPTGGVASGEIPMDVDEPAFQDPEPMSVDAESQDHGASTSGSGVGLRAVLGELANQQADVLVNTTSASLKLSHGVVSRSLLSAAGEELQQEVYQRYPQGLTADLHFACTSAGRLQAKQIFHTALPDWKNNGEKFLRELLEASVKEADSRGFSSIAFPALGTGVLSYPRDLVVRHFQEVASSLLPACRSLREIRVVIFPSDHASVKAFSSIMQERAEPRAGPPTLPKPASRSRRQFIHPAEPSDPATSDGKSQTFVVKNTTIVVKQGNILAENVDIIVNSSNKKLDLSKGAVAQAILKACGPDLQAECKDPKNVKKMQKSGVVITTCKGLPCSSILHMDADKFRSNWKDAILKCLKKAAKRNASIAFPALGTGLGGLSAEESAKAFMTAFMQMTKEFQDSPLTDVRVVIFQQDMFQTFVTAMASQAEAKEPGWMESAMTKVAGWFSGKSNQKSHKKSAEVNTITLYFFSDDATEIQRALNIIKEKFSLEMMERIIPEDTIKTLTPEQLQELEKQLRQHDVEVRVDQSKGEVHIKGRPGSVIEAMNSAHTMLRDIDKARQEAAAAEILSSYMEWAFLDPSGNLQAFDKLTSAGIETAFKIQSKTHTFKDAKGVPKVVEFDKMEMYTAATMGDKVQVIRRDLLQKGTALTTPQHWAAMADHEEVKLVTLASSDPEYQQTEALFRQTLGGSVTIVKIERVQNRTLYSQYVTKKQAMEKQNAGGNPVERQLWHGTAHGAIPSINRYGYNRSYCGKNAVYFGDGVYFAVNSNYSAQATYSPPDNNGDRYMYLARVLTGDFTTGQAGMRVPPAKQGQILYDSVVNNTSNPVMYVIFNDTQAYPEFLITFR